MPLVDLLENLDDWARLLVDRPPPHIVRLGVVATTNHRHQRDDHHGLQRIAHAAAEGRAAPRARPEKTAGPALHSRARSSEPGSFWPWHCSRRSKPCLDRQPITSSSRCEAQKSSTRQVIHMIRVFAPRGWAPCHRAAISSTDLMPYTCLTAHARRPPWTTKSRRRVARASPSSQATDSATPRARDTEGLVGRERPTGAKRSPEQPGRAPRGGTEALRSPL